MVAGLWAGDADTLESRHRLIPDGELWLMFNLGPPQRVVEREGTGSGAVYRTAMVSGMHDQPVTYESVDRHPRVVTVRLLPRGACAFECLWLRQRSRFQPKNFFLRLGTVSAFIPRFDL